MLSIITKSIADSFLSDVQLSLDIDTYTQIPNEKLEYITVLNENNIIDITYEHNKYALLLYIDDVDPSEYPTVDCSVPIATFSYSHDPHTNVAYIGMLSVQDAFRNNGIGTGMKKAMEKHIEQQDINEVYTWVTSQDGDVLATNFDYQTKNNISPKLRFKEL